MTPLQNSLTRLYTEYRRFLSAYPWEWEEDRWGELVKCVGVAIGLTPDQAMRLLEILAPLQLSSVDVLAAADEGTVSFIARVLLQLGVDPPKASTMASTIPAIARGVQREWSGHVQRFLRRHSLVMARELRDHLEVFGVEREAAVRAAILWLQNVSNAPILVEDQGVRDFCARFDLTCEQLVEEADALGLNLSVLDDLLATEQLAEARDSGVTTSASPSTTNEPARSEVLSPGGPQDD